MEELKVLIVDDEVMALEYLRDLISWNDFGYRIVAEATNARHALDCFEKYRPQIVITDICMPGENGLEFCKNLLSIDKSAKIILLTAYKEFEYAKRAIELGVSNYLLKHELSGESLLGELGKVRTELENERDASRIIKKHVIMNFMENAEDIHSDEIFQWEFLNNKYGMFALVIFQRDEPYGVFEAKKPVPYPDIVENLKSSYDGILGDFNFIDCFKLRNRMLAMLFTHNGCIGEAALWNKFYPVVLKTQGILHKAAGSTFSAAVEFRRQEINNITKMYAEALKTIDLVPFFGRSKILRRDDIPNAATAKYSEDQVNDAINSIAKGLDAQDLPALQNGIESLFTGIVAPSFNAELLRRCCDELARLINKWREKNFLPIIRNEHGGISIKPDDCFTVVEIMGTFQSIYKQSIESVLDLLYSNYSKKVQKAIRYLHSHYSEDISIIDVAEAVEISDSNLSRTFKNETGQSLLEYLTSIRIEEAKKLLKDSDYKIYEISDKIGYKTSQYFSQVFFRMTGMQPQDFRGGKKSIDKKQH